MPDRAKYIRTFLTLPDIFKFLFPAVSASTAVLSGDGVN